MSKKAILTIATLVLVITLSSIIMSCGPSEPSQFLTYTDEANGFSIDYPQGWDIKYYAEHPKYKVQFYTVTWELKAVCIAVYKYGASGVNLEGLSELHIKTAPDNFEDYVPISTKELTINGIPAVKHTFTQTIDSTSYKTVMVYLAEGGTEWTLFFDSSQKSFDSYKSTFNTTINNFRLIN